MNRVLLIEDDDAMRLSLVQTLELEDYVVTSANGLEQARRAIRANFPGIILSDIRMPNYDGFDVLARAKAVDPDLPVVFLTGEADVPMAVKALQEGVFDFLEKPCRTEQLLHVVSTGLKQRKMTLQTRKLQRLVETGDLTSQHFPGVSQASERIRTELRALQKARGHLHIWGEEGSGRKLSVECIAQAQPDLRNTYLQCGAHAAGWPEIDTENRSNVFAFALSEATASQLEQLAAWADENTNIRLITIADRNIANMRLTMPEFAVLETVQFYELQVPSIQDRMIDLGVIFETLLQKLARDLRVTSKPLDRAYLEMLQSRRFPRNIYSLEVAARSYLLEAQPAATQSLAERVDQFERTALINALIANNGNVKLTASDLKLPQKTLYDKLSKHALSAKDYRQKMTGD